MFVRKAVAQLTSEGGVWVAMQEKVYDVTGWLPHRPAAQPRRPGRRRRLRRLPLGLPLAVLDCYRVGHLSDYVVSEVSRDYRCLVAEFAKAGLFDRKDAGRGVPGEVRISTMGCVLFLRLQERRMYTHHHACISHARVRLLSTCLERQRPKINPRPYKISTRSAFVYT